MIDLRAELSKQIGELIILNTEQAVAIAALRRELDALKAKEGGGSKTLQTPGYESDQEGVR
jgi:hypothetical protein